VDQVDVLVPGHGSLARGEEIQARIDLDRRYVHALRDGGVFGDPRIGPGTKPGWEWVRDIHEGQLATLRKE
jgi:hypothetical protein